MSIMAPPPYTLYLISYNCPPPQSSLYYPTLGVLLIFKDHSSS